MATNAARTISCKAWNFLVEYTSRESRHDIKESEGNMFNPIFKGNAQGQKHQGRCAFAEPELLYFRKPKRVVMAGLKLTHWTLGYEVEISNFSKLAVFTKLWHALSDKYQAFYTFQGFVVSLKKYDSQNFVHICYWWTGNRSYFSLKLALKRS